MQRVMEGVWSCDLDMSTFPDSTIYNPTITNGFTFPKQISDLNLDFSASYFVSDNVLAEGNDDDDEEPGVAYRAFTFRAIAYTAPTMLPC